MPLPRKNIILSSTGRPPWYRVDGKNTECYLVGIAGGSASGKTSVAERIIRNLNVPWVVIVSMDSFYKELTPEQRAIAHNNDYDFDHPSAFDYDILYEALLKLKQGKSVKIPMYDFSTHSRRQETQTIYGANIIIFEGIFGLYDKKINNLMDLKIFVDTDADIRMARRLKRDIAERGRDAVGVLKQYMRFVKPSYDEFIQPTVRNADVIIPRGLENAVAIDLITKHIRRQLHERALTYRSDLARTVIPGKEGELPSNTIVLPATNQIKGMHTIMRDSNTQRHDFVFVTERLSGLIIERGLEELPCIDIDVETPTESIYHGKQFAYKVCGVSILRAGGTLEVGLRRIIKDVAFGKLLIQSDPSSGEPQLHYCKLPSDIGDGEYYVMLLDALIGTGAAGLMAIRVLLDHDVPEDHIIFLAFLAAPQGLQVIANAFPKVRIITSWVDPVLDPATLFIQPGIGNFANRYFGTEDEDEF